MAVLTFTVNTIKSGLYKSIKGEALTVRSTVDFLIIMTGYNNV